MVQLRTCSLLSSFVLFLPFAVILKGFGQLFVSFPTICLYFYIVVFVLSQLLGKFTIFFNFCLFFFRILNSLFLSNKKWEIFSLNMSKQLVNFFLIQLKIIIKDMFLSLVFFIFGYFWLNIVHNIDNIYYLLTHSAHTMWQGRIYNVTRFKWLFKSTTQCYSVRRITLCTLYKATSRRSSKPDVLYFLLLNYMSLILV